MPGLVACADLDFAFTPATNLPLLRRLTPAAGDARDVDVAWMDVPDGVLQPLAQRYRRLDPHRYAYESPASGYAATLVIDDAGFVQSYPGLWIAVDAPGEPRRRRRSPTIGRTPSPRPHA